MTDLAKTEASTAGGNARIPFDWRLEGAGAGTLAGHDYSLPCQGPIDTAVLLTYNVLAVDRTLDTAVLLSLFSDRRAGPDDALPHNASDRHGWVGDQVAVASGDAWGSLLWLVYVGKATEEVRESARFYCQEALQWMLDSGVAGSVEVTSEWTAPGRLGLRVLIASPGDLAPAYDATWGLTLETHPNA